MIFYYIEITIHVLKVGFLKFDQKSFISRKKEIAWQFSYPVASCMNYSINFHTPV